jgi:hypothetical protein
MRRHDVAGGPWTTVLISLFSAIVGAFLGGGVTQFREWLKERQHRGRVATALGSELMGQLDAVTTCASLANLAEHGLRPDFRMKTNMITHWLPPEPSAYRSLVSQLPLLSPVAVAATISFYGSVEWAKNATTRCDDETLSPDESKALGNAWRAATVNGLRAMNTVLEHASVVRTDVDDRHIALLKEDARAVLKNEWPRVRYNEQTGQMQIGPNSADERRQAAMGRTRA